MIYTNEPKRKQQIVDLCSKMADDVMKQILAQEEILETQVADAVALQDYDMLESLHVVVRYGYPPAVASMIT